MGGKETNEMSSSQQHYRTRYVETSRQTIVNQAVVYSGGWTLLQVKHFIKMSVKRPRPGFILSPNLRWAHIFLVETMSALRQQLTLWYKCLSAVSKFTDHGSVFCETL